MNKMTAAAQKTMETAGFGESFEERIFFTGPASKADPTREARLEARKSALAVMRSASARGSEDEKHCERVATWSRRIAKEIGLSSERVLDIELGALVHDVGWVGLPEISPDDEESLNYAQVLEARTHCDIGVRMLKGIAALRRTIPLVISHHENFDGTGFPSGVAGNAIPVDGRIFRLVDAYEKLTRGPAKMSDAEARQEIEKGVGKLFDPQVYQAFAGIDASEWIGLVSNI